MVAIITSAHGVRGILNYNENKVNKKDAELLWAAGFPRDGDTLSFGNKLERFEKLLAQNQRCRKNAMHVSLNFSKEEIIDNELMKQIALDYMKGIGFGNQPFLLYRHYDAAHPHIHIATVIIEEGGNRIETYNIGKELSEPARKEIEIRYGLVKAEEQKKEGQFMITPVDLDKVIYGKSETKAAISAIVRDVTATYKFASIPEMNAVLRQFNILAYEGEEGSMMREKRGLSYYILNEHGDRVGVPIKASSIFSSPTVRNLEKKFPANKEARKPFGERLKHHIDKAMKSAGDRAHFELMLREKGIRIVMRENTLGQIYGVTFIDNATRVVFNGSALGKAYSANAFVPMLEEIGTRTEAPKTADKTKLSVEKLSGKSEPSNGNNEPSYPASRQPVIFKIVDIVFRTRNDGDAFDPFRKKKKKKIIPD